MPHDQAALASQTTSAATATKPATSSPPLSNIQDRKTLILDNALSTLHMRHIASGRHGSVFALPSIAEFRWSAVKIVHGPIGGRSNGSKPHDALQEARVLGELDHPNIVELLGYEYKVDLYEHHLKLAFLPISLSELLNRYLHPDWIKSVIFQSLLALAHMHDHGIAHRDINPRNIMIDWDGTVKIIDFGLAWTGGDQLEKTEDEKVWYETEKDMICDVGTGRWRAPELLFSPTSYDAFALDLWGIGVVITDMFRPIPLPNSDSEDEDEDPLEEEVVRPQVRTTLFDDGFGDIGLAGSIFRVLGTPTTETWPEFESLPDAGKIDFITCTPRPLGSIFPTMDQDLVDLITALLQLSPSRRISAKKALENRYFDDTLVPSKNNAWYGNPPVDLSFRCVETKDGRRLIDHLADVLEEKRDMWAP